MMEMVADTMRVGDINQKNWPWWRLELLMETVDIRHVRVPAVPIPAGMFSNANT